MNILRIARPYAVGGLVLGLAFAAYASRSQWLPLVQPAAEPKKEGTDRHDDEAPKHSVLLSDQVQLNLGLRAKALKIQTYPKTITVPGMIVDRPGWSDRIIAAPATAVVAKVHRFPGESVRPGEVLFTLKLVSESLQLSQTELFKSTQEIKLARDSKKRLESSGGVPEARIIEVSNQITRLEVLVTAARQELLLRGLLPAMLDAVAEGKFVVDLDILVPEAPEALPRDVNRSAASPPETYELQELKVELGQQVQAGQTLCIIANHRWLAIEGKAFRDETALLEKCVAEQWPVEIDFQEDPAAGWGELGQTFRIGHLSNSIDPLTRTFAFRIPLENSFKLVREQSDAHTLWRFRPGQKVRILVRVAELEGVFVLPADAVVHEGAEAFVFIQNVDTFQRKPVRVLHRDRNWVVLANEESLPVGSFVVQSSAAQLNRMVKSGNGGNGVPKGYHMHADGSVHKNED